MVRAARLSNTDYLQRLQAHSHALIFQFLRTAFEERPFVDRPKPPKSPRPPSFKNVNVKYSMFGWGHLPSNYRYFQSESK